MRLRNGGGGGAMKAAEAAKKADVSPSTITRWVQAAPSVTSVLDQTAQEFLGQVIQIVSDAVEEAGGSVVGIQTNEAVPSLTS